MQRIFDVGHEPSSKTESHLEGRRHPNTDTRVYYTGVYIFGSDENSLGQLLWIWLSSELRYAVNVFFAITPITPD